MPGPDPHPTPAPPAFNRASARGVRNGCVWLVLILLIGVAVVQTVATAKARGGGEALAQATPRVLLDVTVQLVVGFTAALLVHRLAPRVGMWVVVALVLAALVLAARYPAVMRGHVQGWAWIPFTLLLGLAALEAIPAAVHDAAAVDRVAGSFKLRTITLPLVLPLLIGGVVFRAADGYHPADARTFVAAYLLLIAAVIAGNGLARGRQ